MEINGLPAHVLLIHAAVVFAPLAAAVSVVFALVRRWRWATRWPAVGLALVALVTVVSAYLTGQNLKDRFEESGIKITSELNLHQERAQVLLWVTVVFAVVVLLAAWGLGGPSPLASGKGARGQHDNLIEWSLMAGVVVFSLSVVMMTIQTGDAGADAVWGGLQLK